MLPSFPLLSLFPAFTSSLFSSHFTLTGFTLWFFSRSTNIRGYPLHSATTSLSGVATQLFSCLYLPGSSLVERFYCIRPPDLKNTEHSLHVLSGFIYVCLSGRIIFSIHERNLYLDTRSTYQFDTFILSSSFRFTLRLVDSIFSIHRRIDLKFCNLFDNIFDCQKILRREIYKFSICFY